MLGVARFGQRTKQFSFGLQTVRQAGVTLSERGAQENNTLQRQRDPIGLAGKKAVKLEGVRGTGDAEEAGKRVTCDSRGGPKVKADICRLHLTRPLILGLVRAWLGFRVGRVLRRALSCAGLDSSPTAAETKLSWVGRATRRFEIESIYSSRNADQRVSLPSARRAFIIDFALARRAFKFAQSTPLTAAHCASSRACTISLYASLSLARRYSARAKIQALLRVKPQAGIPLRFGVARVAQTLLQMVDELVQL